ncbi:MAG: SDR family NAD(P)-dependent oxidoreductase, partial [Sterolibacterium sp.]|nr:SDR family NAD(P)-dependent oxidoreductase [Sterolibacterium sp.]
AARGARIGVLMGSAYITTHEAVRCGAVNAHFQKKVLEDSDTVLLETAPGHATRCLRSGFVDQFNAEKQRLQAAGQDLQSVWSALENLNVGRLRIAAKGVRREGDKLVKVNAKGQAAEGMYMIGQLVALRHAAVSMLELHRGVSSGALARLGQCVPPALPKAAQAEPVAVVGMSCIYPGSPDLESYWANIVEGRNLVGEVPADRWNVDLYYQAGVAGRGKTPSKWGGFIDEIPFDPLRYGIPPQSLAAIEPVQLLSLEVASRALQDAGYGEGARYFDREKVSVIFGAESGMDLSNAYVFRNSYAQYLGEMPAELDAVLPDLTEDSFPGVLVNVISGRIANRLGLGGVNYSVDAACASSLTAIEVAVKELRSGSSDMVLAGGADFHNSINDFLMFASVKALSPSGSCRSFDDAADGICLGEGVGVVVLKRLSDAQRDGDRVYAVINGIAGSSDGKGLGLTAPRKEGQKRALERAYWQAGVLPGAVGLVEAHGTGTVVGDRTELQTLTEIYNAGGALPLAAGLGSVKSQIGHTKCAAGIAGFIKIAKALYHRVLPPTIGIEKPNAGYDVAHSPFRLNATAQPWPAARAHAAVSAFGFGGTNFHAVLSSCRPEGAPQPAGLARWPAELFLFRAETFEAAGKRMQQLARFLRESDTSLLALRDLAWTVAGQGSGAVQCAIVARDAGDLVFKLECAHLREKQEGVHYRQHEMQGKLAFVFPGQGSQSPGMLQDIFVAFPALQSVLAQGAAWCDHLFPPTAYDRQTQQDQQQAITDTRVAQPVLGMADSAMAMLLQSLGIQPNMLAGHSYGELVALSVAGTLDLAQLLPLSAQRGQAILAAAGKDAGRMAAVSAGHAVLAPLFDAASGVILANQNSPSQTVISGSTPAIEAALRMLKDRGIAARPIEVACAFHSPVVAGAEQAFAEVLAPLDMSAPAIRVYSNVTTQPYPPEAAQIKHLLAAQIVSPVRFVEQIEQMYADGARIFVEVGPGRVLTGLIQKILAGRPHRTIATDQKGQPGIPALLEAVGQLAVLLPQIDATPLWAGRSVVSLDLDKPCKPSATSWLINGAQARPRQGELPRHAGRRLTAPLAIRVGSVSGVSGVPGAPGIFGHMEGAQILSQEPVDQAVFSYLNNMRDLVQAQRDVMLGLLGAPLVEGAAAIPRVSTVARAVQGASLPAPSSSSSISVAGKPAPAVPAANVRDTLLTIVSERTGYPADMLDPELDLEADLSIDSIKRIEIMGELAERIGLRRQLGDRADALLEQLAAQKTLHAITAWLHDKLPSLAAGAPAALAATAAAVATASVPAADQRMAAAAAVAAARLDARQVLLAIVSQRTGYPEDVLDLDLDLEADLSIDSIKRLEIVGELAEKLGLHSLLQDKDSALEHLAALKSLRAIVDWLKQNAGHEADEDGAEAVDATDEDSASEPLPSEGVAQVGQGNVAGATPHSPLTSLALKRYVMRSAEAPQVVAGTSACAGRHFLITDDGMGVARNLASRLEARGAVVRVIDFSEHAAWPEKLDQIDGLVHLFGLSSQARVRDVKRFFALVREALLHKASCLLVASGMGGNFGYFSDDGADVPDDFGHGAGVAGMLKTVTKEWPGVRVHCVDLDLDDPAEDLATYLEVELLADNPLTEVAWRDGSRHQIEVVPAILPPVGPVDQLDLDGNSVVLMTGGARGITAQLAVELARRYGCQLELVGRSPLPKNGEDAVLTGVTETKALRQALIRLHPDWKPAEVEKQAAHLQSVREIRQTLAAIEAAGGRASYNALDVRDIEVFGAFIEDIYRRHGRLDGVIHGAGVVEDKLLRHKTPESFQRVFDTKVRGALMLYKLIRDDVRFVVFFSSVAGAFGNKGQVDYATANDVLDKIAHALQGRIKGRVLSVNWGPWAGTGMVSPELEREYARKGIGLIPLDEGVDALLRELQFGVKKDTQVVFMCATPENMGMAS